MTDVRVNGNVAMILGGSGGIGAACALRLAADGADLAIVCHRSAAKAAAVAVEAEALGVRADVFEADLGDLDQAENLADAVAEKFGRIDVLVNAAGTSARGTIGSFSREQVARHWAVNVHGIVALTERVIGHMPDGGRIVMIGSASGERAVTAGFATYAASKAAISMYARGWAQDLASRRITVNTVLPGFTHTDLSVPADSDMGRQIIERIPFRRYADPEEIAAVVGFVASPQSSYMTGANIPVDGGWNA